MIKGTTRVCGLIGNPVGHSLSPFIHNKLSEAMGTDMAYVTFKVENDIVSAVKGAYELNILGLNVTVPWKEGVMRALSGIDEAAEKIGAVNTLVRSDGGYIGYNTDILGIKRELMEEGVVIKDNTVVILGAGGAARSIAVLMAISGAGKIYILNRTLEKAENISESVKKACDYDNIVPLGISDHSNIAEKDYVVIQTTSVGLYPNVSDSPISDRTFFENAKCGVDIIYNPFETRFMQLMKEAGKPAYNGLKMLLYQAVAAFELWQEVSVPADVIDKVYNDLQGELLKRK